MMRDRREATVAKPEGALAICPIFDYGCILSSLELSLFSAFPYGLYVIYLKLHYCYICSLVIASSYKPTNYML